MPGSHEMKSVDVKSEDGLCHGIAICLGLAAVAAFLISFLVLGYQCLRFLKTGAWTSHPTAAAFNTDTVDSLVVHMKDWVGVLKIFLWVLDQPLTLSLAGLGIALVISSAWAENSRH